MNTKIKIPAGLTVEKYKEFLYEKMDSLLDHKNYGPGEIQQIVKILLQLN
jgi:hypothetical protein